MTTNEELARIKVREAIQTGLRAQAVHRQMQAGMVRRIPKFHRAASVRNWVVQCCGRIFSRIKRDKSADLFQLPGLTQEAAQPPKN